MPNRVSCNLCLEKKSGPNSADLTLNQVQGDPKRIRLRGQLECTEDGHKWPIEMMGDQILEVSRNLPSAESKKLELDVPEGIKQDLMEAEETHFSGHYKASVVMCRRALQLALEVVMRNSEDDGLTLGELLKLERKANPRLFKELTAMLAARINDQGNVGAHRLTTLDPKTVEVVIHDTVVALNELSYPKPPSEPEDQTP